MKIDIKLKKNFVTAYNRMQETYGEDMARINGFADSQLSYTDFIDNFIDEDTVADASIDGNSNVSHKDIVTLLSEMPKPHRKLLAFNKMANSGITFLGKTIKLGANIDWNNHTWYPIDNFAGTHMLVSYANRYFSNFMYQRFLSHNTRNVWLHCCSH